MSGRGSDRDGSVNSEKQKGKKRKSCFVQRQTDRQMPYRIPHSCPMDCLKQSSMGCPMKKRDCRHVSPSFYAGNLGCCCFDDIFCRSTNSNKKEGRQDKTSRDSESVEEARLKNKVKASKMHGIVETNNTKMCRAVRRN